MSARSLPLKPPGRWESFFILVSMLLVTQAFTPILMAGSASDDALGDSNPATLLSALVVYAIAFMLLMRRPKRRGEAVAAH